MNNFTPDYLLGQIQLRSEILQIYIRQKSGLSCTLPKCRLGTGQRVFAFDGDEILNSLPKEIRDTESLSGFKKSF